MRGPVEQLGCARRPVKAEVAGSNPVGTARTGTSCLLSPGQVAQSVERAAENRKVGGSIPSLPTTSALVSRLAHLAPRWTVLPIEASLSHRPLWTRDSNNLGSLCGGPTTPSVRIRECRAVGNWNPRTREFAGLSP